MNLRNVCFWKTQTVSPVEAAAQSLGNDTQGRIPAGVPAEAVDNVVALPGRSDGRGWRPNHPGEDFVTHTSPSPIRFTGLMNAPELTAFFEENYFGLGRHNGANYKTQEALDLGKESLIAKFQNALTDLIERNQTRGNRIQNELIAIEGVSQPMSAQLRLACEHLRRDIAVLHEQIDSAREGKGWILEALNRYQMGFTKGLREAINFELLAG